MVSLISSLSRLCQDCRLEEVSEANRKHERHPSAGIAHSFTRKDKKYELGDFMLREETFLVKARAKGDSPAASGVLKASVVGSHPQPDPPLLSMVLIWGCLTVFLHSSLLSLSALSRVLELAA